MPKYNLDYDNGIRTLDAPNDSAAAEMALSIWGEEPKSIALAPEEEGSNVQDTPIQATLNLTAEPLIRIPGSMTITSTKGYLTLELPRAVAVEVLDRIVSLQAELSLEFAEITE